MRDEEAYKTLGLCPGASRQEIRAAYCTLARQLHPDASGNPETAQAFSKLTEAYDELRRSPKRTNPRIRASEEVAVEPVPVRRRSATSRSPAEPLLQSRRDGEPLRRSPPGAEPLRATSPVRSWPVAPSAAPRSPGSQLERLLWLLFDED